MTNQPIINIAGYKFVSIPLEALNDLCEKLTEKAESLKLKGTILLSKEGVNAFMAGVRENVDGFVHYLRTIKAFSDIHFKESISEEIPFSRLLVRVKNEIVTMDREEVCPEKETAPYLTPESLKVWYENGYDFVLLDTRNNYEVALGTFDDAIELNIEHFRDFPDAVTVLPNKIKQKPIVTFCTGGIRCEKAAEFMKQKGFKEVYQLEGGILNYFEKVGGAHYHGDCFVFDKRLTVDNEIKPTKTDTCYQHRIIENCDQLQESIDCPYCDHIKESRRAEAAA